MFKDIERRASGAADLAECIKGVHFPVEKAELLKQCRDGKVHDILEKIPDKVYDTINSIEEEYANHK